MIYSLYGLDLWSVGLPTDIPVTVEKYRHLFKIGPTLKRLFYGP